MTILAVNPGTKYVALAVFRDAELREWQIKIFKGEWSTAKMKKIIAVLEELIGRYEVDVLAVKRVHASRSSQNLNQLVGGIKEMGRARTLLTFEYSIKELERCFCPGERGSKKKMAEAVVLEYPVLWNELEKERRHKNPYYTRLFEAVALGSICHDDMDSIRPAINH